jgi:2-dehydro-3-deoxyphosphogluconate aldolase / (4S)-4-hydroxy-2-oxoglutarate aldolase
MTATPTIEHGRSIADVMRLAPVIPVLIVEEIDPAVAIAEALVAGGLRVIEVTLRTPVALSAIREMTTVPGAVVGAGTVLDTGQVERVRQAGAEFVVSPGLTKPLATAAHDCGIPFLPGVATAGEVMRGLDLGLQYFKFFPAASAGGLPTLRALAAVFASARFCPTGGITADTADDWLREDAVICVGGSWLVPPGPLDLAAITKRAREASALAE